MSYNPSDLHGISRVNPLITGVIIHLRAVGWATKYGSIKNQLLWFLILSSLPLWFPNICWLIHVNPHINWLVVWNLFFSICWDCHHPNWRTHIFQRGRYTNQVMIIYSYIHSWCVVWVISTLLVIHPDWFSHDCWFFVISWNILTRCCVILRILGFNPGKLGVTGGLYHDVALIELPSGYLT